MVLYKRKQVPFTAPPDMPLDPETQVWVIPRTKEWFLTYEEYLERLDFYNRPKFVCEITGNSCLTYFQALDSEEHERKEVDKNFPENLREHILRYLQFNRVSRSDQLVDQVYHTFKNDYFPGETVYLKGLDKKEPLGRLRGIIREKVQYGENQPTKYLVVRSSDKYQAIVTQEVISRDRNQFTKWLIKTFIKLTMTRSHKVGAPWVVKSTFAKQYGIPTTYPEDLRQYMESTPSGEPVFMIPKKKKTRKRGRTASEAKKESKQEAKKEAKQEAKQESKRKKEQLANAEAKRRKLAKKEEERQQKLLEKQQKQLLKKQQKQLEKQQQKLQQKQEQLKREKEQLKAATPTVDMSATIPYRKKFPTHHIPEALQREIEEEERNGSQTLVLSLFQPTKKSIAEDLLIKFDIQNSKPVAKKLRIQAVGTSEEEEEEE